MFGLILSDHSAISWNSSKDVIFSCSSFFFFFSFFFGIFSLIIECHAGTWAPNEIYYFHIILCTQRMFLAIPNREMYVTCFLFCFFCEPLTRSENEYNWCFTVSIKPHLMYERPTTTTTTTIIDHFYFFFIHSPFVSFVSNVTHRLFQTAINALQANWHSYYRFENYHSVGWLCMNRTINQNVTILTLHLRYL